MPTVAARPVLLVSRARPARTPDVATGDAFIADQRHPARRWRQLRRAGRVLGRLGTVGLASLALAITAAAVAHGLVTSSLLAVRTVEVIGARRVPAASILEAARVEPGMNLLTLDAAAVAARVGALPGVRRAHVVRHLPYRVAVLIEEREPFALVSSRAGGLFWVDAEGHLVGPERRPIAPRLPVVSGVEPPVAGDHAVGDRLHTGLAFLRAVQRAGGRVAERISEIDVAPAGGPVLYTTDGVAVWMGAEAWDERLGRLDGVLGELDARREPVESVDLRFRDLVVWRPRAKER